MFKYDRYDILALKFISGNPYDREKIYKHSEKLITERNYIMHQGRCGLKLNKL